ncbi:NotI family restriction endonuclease [Pseudophaeobacter sp. C1-32P7]|uniref:NotI family restriction endonuclease n=1 Tax=Pseudophaeobacter sp. C1-32P7 TaxID=3098142 RepID=UPI0034D39B03
MKKAEIDRMIALERKKADTSLTDREEERLKVLHAKKEKQFEGEMTCPFRTDTPLPTCTKPGGVCSLRVYSDVDGTISPVDGERGMIRAICPYRFHQDNTVFQHIGDRLLNDGTPVQAGEVGFLESTGNLDSAPGEDVGRIDMILVQSNASEASSLNWAAVEIQAVYFSGKEMKIEFDDLIKRGGSAAMPVEARRPDYRSSGPKRLMPQLQIKVPTLRRWGKKMAIVVDVPFFRSMGQMRPVNDISNSDIVWILVDFVKKPGSDIAHLEVVEEFATTLESAIEGLTGGVAVPLGEFEARIIGKIASP